MIIGISEPTKEHLFSPQELASVCEVPKHVAIIMDGNRRWGRAHAARIGDPLSGHWEGARTLFQIVRASVALGIEHLTLFGFSTENWVRPAHEVHTVLSVIERALEFYQQPMIEYGVRLSLIGDLTAFSPQLQASFARSIEATQQGSCMSLTLALNYGGRDDLRRAMQKIAIEVRSGQLAIEQLTEEMIPRYLDTAQLPDPDLLIRTSGELRLSNFLLCQVAYSELYVTSVLWPDFSPQELLKALQHYQKRVRRRGQ